MIGNPLSNLMSHRIDKLYDQKGAQFVSLRKRFYAKMKRTTRSLRWKMLSNEEAIQKSFELYYQMREDELGIKPDRENSVGLNYVKLSRASG